MLKKLFKTFKKSKKEENYDEYYPELDSSQNDFSIKYAEVKEETKEGDVVCDFLPHGCESRDGSSD